jgi:hypothetical protein
MKGGRPLPTRGSSTFDVMAALVEHGLLLQSARGPVPNVAELIAAEPIKGSWWAHSKSHDIFAARAPHVPAVKRRRISDV